MKIDTWRQSEARVANYGFFDEPLAETTLFRFATSKLELNPHRGAFSLKLVLDGQERYSFGSRRVRLRPDAFLLVNEDQLYASSIDQLTESLSIFFHADEVNRAAQSVSCTHESLLEHPLPATAPLVAQIAVTTSPAMRCAVNELLVALDGRRSDEVRQAADLLLCRALHCSLSVAPLEALANVRRRSTREELLSRVLRARTRIDDCGGLGCDLDRLAHLACLSKFHFLRVFQNAFGETPACYSRRLRLTRAEVALRGGADRVEVARRAGYKDWRALQRTLRQLARRTSDRA